MEPNASAPKYPDRFRQYNELDSPPEPSFDRLAQLAADTTTTPIALVCLLDGERIWFKARVGVEITEVQRSQSLCKFTVRQNDLLIIEDLQTDPRFADAGLYPFDRTLRFYAGAPLIGVAGDLLGTLCVLDRRPRPMLDERQQRMFRNIAASVVEQLDLRREQHLQASLRAEIDLFFEMQSTLESEPSFLGALESSIGHIVRATGAVSCNVWEWPEPGDMVRSLGVIFADPDEARLYSPPTDGQLVPIDELQVRTVFHTPGGTMWKVLNPDDPMTPRLRESIKRGIGSLVACSLSVGGRRFALLLAFRGVHSDLAAMAARLGRMSQALRPLLQRRMDDEQMRLLSSGLSATNDGVMISLSSDPEGPVPIISVVNAAFCAQFGYSADQLIGQSPFILYGDDHDRIEKQRVLAAMWAGQPYSGEVHRKRQDGSTFWAEMTINPLRNHAGWITHWVTIQRDITEKRASILAQQARERTVVETAKQLRALTEQLMRTQRIGKFGHWHWEAGKETLDWSESIYPLFGVTPETFTPTLSSALTLVHPDDRELMLSSVHKALSSGAPYVHEYRALGPDGVIRHHWSEASCERDEMGNVRSLSGIVQDITDRKEAQAMLLRTEKLRSVGQLTGGIAHDFNNLLTVIAVNLEMMSDLIEPDHPAEDLRLMALRASESGAQLTASLLAFARRQPLKPVLVEINQMLQDVRLLAMRSLGERHNIVLRLMPDLPLCRLDRAGFEGAVLNLLLNSRDAMPDGGTIEISTAPKMLPSAGINLQSALPAGDYILITVADTGTGIPPDLMERVFEPFFTTKPIGKGSGLGLSTVIGFVRQSGGEVELVSDIGKGTSVQLYLPAVKPAA